MSEENQDRLKQNLSALTASAENGSDEQSYVGLLRDICILGAGEPVAGCTVANKILSIVRKKFDSTCQRLVEKREASCGSDDKELFNLLEVAVTSVESAKALFERICFDDDAKIEGILVALSLGLDLLHSSYAHLKEKSLYGEHLRSVEDALSNLSSHTVHLQTVLLQCLEKLHVGESHEKQLTSLSSVCEKLSQLALLLEGLDLKMLISARKILVKTLLQYRDGLKHKFSIDSAVSDLCRYVTEWLLELEKMEQRKEGSFLVEMKAVAFHLRLLDSLLLKYEGYYSSSMKNVVKMIVILSRLPALEVYAANLVASHRSSLMLHVWIAAEHLVAVLADNTDFCGAVLGFDLCENFSPGNLLLLTTILDHIVNASDMWLQPPSQTNILDLIFSCIDKCIVELQCPVFLEYSTGDGRAPRKIGLYENVCIHMCRFVATLPAKYFPALEHTLLANVFSESHWRAFLAADVWCFVARYGSPQLCYEHVQLLVRLAKLIPGKHVKASAHVKQLLARLFDFMADEHKALLIQLHSKDLQVLSSLPLSKVMPTAKANAMQLLNKFLCKTITSLELKTLEHFLQHLKTSSKAKSDHLPVSILLKALKTIPYDQSLICSTLTECLISLIVSQVAHLNASSIGDVLRVIESLHASGVDSLQTITALHLSSFGAMRNLSGSQKAEVCERLARSFALVLSSENYIVQHIAMVSFAQFAQVTEYNTVITKAVECPSLKQAVTSFLLKEDLQKHFCWPSFVSCQEKMLSCSWKGATKDSRGNSASHVTEEVIPEKRRKCEDETEKLIATIENAVAKLLHAENIGAMKPRLSRLQEQMNAILNSL
ncbi:hypothetical protein V5799_014949 [Amblyomma americanum]|uniref:Uncharacterized protein n=1 Tax=Amblyomma americanum TaxID=6943 RepID=A0AAQ4E1J7_AMBAM